MRILGKYPVRTQDALFAEVMVRRHGATESRGDDRPRTRQGGRGGGSERIRIAEERGHQHRLEDRAALGMSEVVGAEELDRRVWLSCIGEG